MIVRKCEVDPVRVRRPGLPLRQRLARVSADPGPSAAPACPRAWSNPTGLRRRSSPRPPRPRPATTRTSRSTSMAGAIGSDLARTLAEPSLATLSATAADTRRVAGPDPRRHQVRVRPRPGDRQDPPDRRGAHARQLALLAEGSVPARRPAAFVRQAVRPRLARRLGLGQGQPPAASARRRGRQDPGQVHPSVRDPDRAIVPLEVTCSAT